MSHKLDAKRARARLYIPRLKKLVEQDLNFGTENDRLEFIKFVQDVLDAYMMHECLLGRVDYGN